MRSFGNKNKWRYVLYSKPVLILLLIVLVIFAWSVFGFWGKARETAKNKEIAQKKVEDLEEKKAKLSLDLTRFKTEAGVEDSIRDKFGLAKEGEGLIVIVDDKNKGDVEPEEKGGFWSFFTRWFK